MIQIVLVGLGAGAAAALLFASVVSGSLAAVFLFYLAPLPIMIAALGWSHIAGLIAAASATAAVAVLSGVFFVAVPVIAFGAWWLGYLALLARPAVNGGGGALEWYPVGRLVLWAAVLGTLIVAAAVPNFGTDQESLQAALRKTYERILRDQALIDVLVVAVPPAAAVFSTVTNVFNLWLAARAEDIGVGWVSILDHSALKRILGVPKPVKVLAYLCLGYVSNFAIQPDLATAGWRERIPLERLIHHESWGNTVTERKGRR